VAPCARCGTFLCGACTEVMQEAAYCADCVAWLHKNGAPSRGVQGTIALSLTAIAAFPLCLLFAPMLNLVAAVLGLWVPTRELRRIRRGDGPLRGAWQAKTARVLAAVNLLLALGWLGLFLYAYGQSAAR
jgi:hypothetical protein